MNEAQARELGAAHGLFAGAPGLVVASAPGRLDVMGGIADYSGSLVLQLPLPLRAHAAVGAHSSRRLRAVSLPAGGSAARTLEVDLDALLDAAGDGYAAGRALLCDLAGWAGYVLGSVAVLARERGVRPRSGFDLLLRSEVPEGKGVASSAAIEVACASAIAQMMGVALAPRELAMLCQRVENEIVGAACGVMDQMTAACGEDGLLLRLLCQPAEIEGHVPVPAGFQFFGVDSGVRHAVSGADYTSVRIGAFMGWRILADVALPGWGSHLANVTPDEWTKRAAYVPERILGADFLARYGQTHDPVTRVDPARTYAVRQPTAHPILEHARVREFADLLPSAAEPAISERLGALMAESHASYSACGLGSAATDAIVAQARAAGPAAGIFGAKITGGGSGGTVAVFARADVDAARLFGAERLIGGST